MSIKELTKCKTHPKCKRFYLRFGVSGLSALIKSITCIWHGNCYSYSMKTLILGTLLLLSACGGGGAGTSITWVKGYTTDELNSYIKEFEAKFNQKVKFEVLIVKKFSNYNSNNNATGECIESDGVKRVEILDSVLGQDVLLRYVTFHELGHCQLNLKHYDVTDDIMNTHINFSVGANLDWYFNKMLTRYKEHVYKIKSDNSFS